MSSGKQTSFEFGEVSPTLQFRSDAVSYSSGLSKLRNMYVRREGGVSNRTGFQFLKKSRFQGDIPTVGGKPGIKGFTYWNPANSTWNTVEYANYNTGGVGIGPYGFSINGGVPIYSTFGFGTLGPTADKIRFTLLKDHIFLTPESLIGSNDPMNLSLRLDGTVDSNFGLQGAIPPTSAVLHSKGTAPYLPVSYYVSVILIDGTEHKVGEYGTVGYVTTTWDTSVLPGGAGIVYPTSTLTAGILLTFPANNVGQYDNIKSFNFYRASGAGKAGNSFYKLTSRILPTISTSAPWTVTFDDFGADDPSITPPLDDSILFSNGGLLRGAECAAYYQQRLIMGMKPGIVDYIKSGDMYASKLGAETQLAAPVIYSDTGAFQFSIPVTDGTPVVACVAMQGLVAFTERAVYNVRGGVQASQGVITATSVVPLLVSEEGCSKLCEPKMNGSRGFYVNNSHTKLMAIEYSVDGNMNITEASIFSNHTLLEDVIQIEVLGGGDNTIFFLRRDGKLVQVTSTLQGSYGFAIIETNGYVESIFRGKAQRLYAPNTVDLANSERYYDVLMAYIIRNGVRTLERLNFRDDLHREGEFFADCFSAFGQRLSINPTIGYSSDISNFPAAVQSGNINIKNITLIPATVLPDYRQGIPVKIQCANLMTSNTFVLHFFYDDVDGNAQFLRFISNGAAPTVGVLAGFTHEYVGYFTSDVPANLQNVNANTTIAQNEKLKRYTRWAPAFNTITGDAALLGPWTACAADPTVDSTAGLNIGNPAYVTVSGDGEILSSPNNPNGDKLAITRTGGVLTLVLPDYYSYGYVGAPYTSEFETLDLETSDSKTFTDVQKLIQAVGIGFNQSRGGFYGKADQPIDQMEEIVPREDTSFNNVTGYLSGYMAVYFPSNYDRKGRVNIKQVDPAPISILSVYPKGIQGD